MSGRKESSFFVTQKQAALDVVRNNLEAIGNEDYLLEIFSIKANKKAVMDSLRKRNEKEEPRLANLLDSDLKQLNKVKDQLNEYSNLSIRLTKDGKNNS